MTLPQVAMLGAFEAVHSPNPLRLTLRFLLAVSVFATMSVWLRLNRPALDLQDWCDCAGERMTIRVVESARPRPRIVPLELQPVPAPVEQEYEVATR